MASINFVTCAQQVASLTAALADPNAAPAARTALLNALGLSSAELSRLITSLLPAQAPKYIAAAVSTSLRPLAFGPVRTFTEIAHDVSFDTPYGSWDPTHTRFTFSQPGSYVMSLSGAVATQVVTGSGNRTVSGQSAVGVDLVIAGVSYAGIGFNFSTTGLGLTFDGISGGISIPLNNIQAGDTVFARGGTNPLDPGVAANAWFSLPGTQPDGANAASGIFIHNM